MSIGERITEERKRMALNQDDFAALGGVKRRAQSTYETGERVPDAAYLAAIAEAGADVAYILTGVRSTPAAPALASEWKADDPVLQNHSRPRKLTYAQKRIVEACREFDARTKRAGGMESMVQMFVIAWNSRRTGNFGIADEFFEPEVVAEVPILSVFDLTYWHQDYLDQMLDPRANALLNNYKECSEEDRRAIERIALLHAEAKQKEVTEPKKKKAG